MNVFALVPAAGLSLRMGTEKLRLSVNGQPVLARVIRAFREGGVEKVLVVLGPATADLTSIVENAGARVLNLSEGTRDMQETLQRGLTWIKTHWQPLPTDAVFLSPADLPAIPSDVVCCLKDTLKQHPEAFMVKPSFAGKRGHPVLCRWLLASPILDAAPGTGLNRVLSHYREATITVEAMSPNILIDMDTPADYEQIKRVLRDGSYPTS